MKLIWLIPLLPAAGAAVNGLFGIRWFSRTLAGGLACAVMAGAFGLSAWAFVDLLARPEGARVYDVVLGTWIPPILLATANGISSFTVPWSLRLDPLAAVMLLVVTGIGSIIHVYATAYMKDEPRGAYARFFCYLNLFCFFMLVLVLAGNFLVLFAGWEGVGLCSYLLIGFWYEKTSAADAGKKAFLTNRIGDCGLPAWHLPRVLHVRHARFSRGRGGGRRHAARDRRLRRPVDRVPAALRRRGGEERADSAPCLAAGCDGRADARVRPDPRRHDGDRRRLSRRPQRDPLRAGPARDADRGDRRARSPR